MLGNPFVNAEPSTASFASNNPFRARTTTAPPIPAPRSVSPDKRGVQPPPRPISRNPFLDIPADSPPPARRPSTAGDDVNSLTSSFAKTSMLVDLNDAPPPPPYSSGSGKEKEFRDEKRELRERDERERRLERPHHSSRSRSGVEAGDRERYRDREARERSERIEKSRPRERSERERNERDRDYDRHRSDRSRRVEEVMASSRPRQRTRSNSESSVTPRKSDMSSEKDRDRERERRRREKEREARKDGKTGSSASRKKGPVSSLDKIDRLDVTGIFGSGTFHHDGPFDACRPSRNKNGTKAPVLAFPENSTSNSLNFRDAPQTVSATEAFMGKHHHGEAYNDFSSSARLTQPLTSKLRPTLGTRGQSFDPTAQVEPVYGETTEGLGPTTFLEGTPAPRTEAHRKYSDEGGAASNFLRPRSVSSNNALGGNTSGLGRKKSVIQRLRGLNARMREEYEAQTSPAILSPGGGITSPTGSSASIREEPNVFSQQFESDPARKETSIQFDNRPSPTSLPSSPAGERAGQGDYFAGQGVKEKKGGGGLLSRVKSISKKRRE
ncbi:Pal1-domain-containing protein [Saitoella complicata NRRL Y-17804]|uniref:Pal1-domain-containing protein n=1 Tax=Saitoella complicata (strain BCRC 22490 / CBS 7301 / JCM 7358 / NBRC 10748 / NRRL Y-17804) TaxID=698492 RepID=UPI0008677359|nr:Pal1-domain-containing protein [Saitoella complicata NRRL Y-17804]ODQ50886.1 Pal1-domain-containing protein [Saitoella complicata NRRL Y-17804]